ncbi:shikimate kinase [Patescibacteria group bacterium]|nr:shikimate kinase [Patescibacteria group bacterium]
MSIANKNSQRIVLTGFMGSGKSVVADKIAKFLGLEMVEMDEIVLAKSGRKSINEIFDKDGEDKFRELEAKVAEELGGRENVVIATGGGVGINEKVLKKLVGTTVFLDTPFDEIEKRLEGDVSRPLFRDKNRAQKLFTERLPQYRANADYIVLTGGKDIDEVAREVAMNLIFMCGGGGCGTCGGCNS